MSDKGGFSLVFIFNTDIIIPLVNIKFGEDFHSLEFVDEIGDEEKRVCVVNSVFVDIVIVLTGTKTTIFLFDKKEEGCLWGVQMANLASLQILIKEVFGCLLFFGGESMPCQFWVSRSHQGLFHGCKDGKWKHGLLLLSGN